MTTNGPERAKRYAHLIMNKGMTLQQIGDSEGIGREAVRQILYRYGWSTTVAEFRQVRTQQRLLNEHEVRRAKIERLKAQRLTILPSNRPSHPTHWTEETIVDAISDWLDLGGDGTVVGWMDDNMAPSSALICNRIGWAQAVYLARCELGEDVDPPAERKARKDIVDREYCVSAVAEFLLDPDEVRGGADAYERWAREREGVPSQTTVRNRFGGSWVAAKTAAVELIQKGEAN